MVNDFLMTMSSEDEAAQPTASTSKPKALTKKLLSRKEQLAAKKGAKVGKKAVQKRKRVEESEGSEEEQAVIASDDDQAAMDGDFHFDGLGGGFVGEKRMQVWVSSSLRFLVERWADWGIFQDSGQNYMLPVRPNAIVSPPPPSCSLFAY